MATTRVQVIIDAKDNASKVVKGLNSSLTDAGKNLSALGGTLTKNFTLPILAAGAAIITLASRAGKVESVTDAYKSMVASFDVGSQELIENVKKATAGTVDQMTIMQQFLKASTLIGKDALGEGGENFTRFATLAKKAARATGQDVDFMFESIINGIGRTSVKWLDNTGVVISATDAYKKYGEELGKTASELTESEKKIAITNEYLRKAEGVYKDVAVSAGGVSSTLARFKVAMIESGDAIGLALIPAVQELVESLTPIIVDKGPKLAAGIADLIKKFTDLAPWIKKTVGAMVLFLAVIGPVLSILGQMKKAFVLAKYGLKALKIGFLLLKGPIASVTGLLLANPIVLIIMGIIAVVALLVVAWKKNWGDIQGKTKKAVDGIKSAFKGLIGVFKLIFKGDFTASFGKLFNVFEDSAIVTNILNARNAIKEFATGIKEGIGNAFTSVVDGITTFFQELPGKLSAFLEAAKVAVVKFFIEDIPYAIGFLVGRFEKLVTVDIPFAIGQMITFFTETIPAFLVSLAQMFVAGIVAIYNIWVEFFTVTIPETIKSFINWASEAIPAFGRALVQWFKTMVENVKKWWEWMKTEGVRVILEFIKEAIAKVVELYTRFTDWIKKLVKDVYNGLLELPGKVKVAMNKVKDAAISKAKEIYEGVKEWFDKIIGFFGSIIDKAGEALTKAREAFTAGREQGLRSEQTGGIVPGPIGAAVPILAHGGERVISAGVATGGSGSGGGVNLQVNIGLYAGTETEKRNIAKNLYAALVQTAQAQNKTVFELMET